MRIYLFILTLVFSGAALANKGTGELYVNLQKLHSLKRVLYVAAHPDDENTRALAWFSLSEKAETAYFSLTRGDGGQNLIGDELSEELGVLRTQELLAARSFDKARQFFSRAVDFGYSRSAEESFEKWGKAEVLSDLVLVIRQFKPDVIVTRFPPDKRAGHGHHIASAMLAIEAFEKAADPAFLPEQVKEYGSWQATSVYWNSSVWWNTKLDSIAKDNPDYLVADIGGYSPALGMSYNQIGTLARSEHKCQGFGGLIEMGSRIEYFENLAGEKLKDSFFEKNDKSWTKLVDEKFEETFDKLLNDFDFLHPEENVATLFEIQKGLEKLESSPFKREKLKLCNQLIADCIGLHCELISNDYSFLVGEALSLKLNAINRSPLDVELTSISVNGKKQELKGLLSQNRQYTDTVAMDGINTFSDPYWLKQPFDSRFKVDDPSNLGKPQNDASVLGLVEFKIGSESFTIEVPGTYKWRDPSYGERRRDLICVPDFTVNLDQDIAILKPGGETTVRLKVHAFKPDLKIKIHLSTPAGWILSENTIDIDLSKKHEEKYVEFSLKSAENAERGLLTIRDEKGNDLMSYTEIVYDHIPTQIILQPAKMECISLDARIQPGKVAYIKGVDDAVPQAIEQLGFEVETFEVSDLSTLDLSIYQSVVLGIRIYNVHPELGNFDTKLANYVQAGGNLIMQYNTASRSQRNKKFGPVEFQLSRNRVTEEDAEVTFLAADHPIMNYPNKITTKDFDHWVQERGLYFATNWDDAFTPLFAWHDKDQEDVKGALIVAPYGQGQFVYTGISFFRELPKGVEGAYRLFANLLSYQKGE
ncbi:MAG: PIG-L family deacetylase [Flavobacteriales bacterium]|nr:PIG-L family deacetylase [Flavobacteriales bacterium]